jgi:cytochrome c556
MTALTNSELELGAAFRTRKAGDQGKLFGVVWMRSRSVRTITLATVVAGMAAAPVLASAASDIITSRIAGLRELGAQFKNVNDELKKDDPSPMILQISARQIRDVAKNQYGWFPAGSGPEAGVKTKAKPEIWAKAADFKAAQDNFAKQANAFFVVAQKGDVASMKAQVRQLGAACGGCHRTFRAEAS